MLMVTAVSGSAGSWAWRTAGGGGVGLLSELEGCLRAFFDWKLDY
ncbi:hypothetical protein SynSYN20_02560 [Synechococcus sp. SYN20]|nr:hypothetical protein SynSYN20_02560 [Synechococcus sp. SYN20]